jgi:hypothetical protein
MGITEEARAQSCTCERSEFARASSAPLVSPERMRTRVVVGRQPLASTKQGARTEISVPSSVLECPRSRLSQWSGYSDWARKPIAVSISRPFAPTSAISEKARKKTGKTSEKGPENGGNWRFLLRSKAPFRRASSCGRSLQSVSYQHLTSRTPAARSPPKSGLDAPKREGGAISSSTDTSKPGKTRES